MSVPTEIIRLAEPIAEKVFDELLGIADAELRKQVLQVVRDMITDNKYVLRAHAQELLDERHKR